MRASTWCSVWRGEGALQTRAYQQPQRGRRLHQYLGNFHEGNAAQYTDVTLFTARKRVVQEVGTVFGFIQKPYVPIRFKELLVSPNDMRRRLLARIDKEIRNAAAGKPAYIMGKLNHITDRALVQKLYEASAAGVRIDLLVRGNCSLVTGIPGRSDNIRINGIIDRYLEHSRILIFANGGKEAYYIGSADWMPRNFDNRIEVMAPVHDTEIRRELKRIITYGTARYVPGTYRRRYRQESALDLAGGLRRGAAFPVCPVCVLSGAGGAGRPARKPCPAPSARPGCGRGEEDFDIGIIWKRRIMRR